MRRLLAALLVAAAPGLALAGDLPTIAPTPAATDSGDRIATTGWANLWAASAMPLANGKIWIGSAGGIATAQTPSGDWTISAAGVAALATVNSNVGSFGSASQCTTFTVNGKGLITAASAAACAPATAYFQAYPSAATQSVTNATPTKVSINTKVSDSNTWFDAATNFRFTPLTAGRYRFEGSVSCGGTTVVTCLAILEKNGSQYAEFLNTSTNGGAAALSVIVTMNGTTDYVELWGQVNCSASCVINGGTGPQVTWFQGNFIAP